MAQIQGAGFSKETLEAMARAAGYTLLPHMTDDIVAYLNSILLRIDSVPEEIIKDIRPAFVSPPRRSRR